MSGEIEAAGAAMTAGLAARAIEGGGPGAGEAHSACFNCGTSLAGAYCHACGQSAHVERKLLHVFEEFLHGIVHFDTTAWRTLPKLIARPGTLTHEYIHGRRSRYVSPLATFLFIVFMMFLAFALVGEVKIGRPDALTDLAAQSGSAAVQVKSAESKFDAANSALAKIEAQGAAADPDRLADAKEAVSDAKEALDEAKTDAAAIDGRLARRQEIVAQLRAARARLDINEAKAKAEKDKDELDSIATAREILDDALSHPDGAPDGIIAKVRPDGDVDVAVTASREGGVTAIFDAIRRSEAAGRINVNTGSKKLDEKFHEKLCNPEYGWYKIQNTAYKFSFLLVPLSLPFVAFLFLFKKDVTLYDHVVFILYSLSFMSLLLMLLVLVGRFAPGLGSAFGPVAASAPLVHMFFHLGGTYRLKLFLALWRTFVLSIFALIALAIFLGLIIYLGLTG
jgi:hypothetical protein